LNDQSLIKVLGTVQENVSSLVDRGNQMAHELVGPGRSVFGNLRD
jgi:hypothetical protein